MLPALAAAVTWVSPGPGAVVTGTVDLVVRVDRQVGESVDGVAVRLSDDGDRAAPGTVARDLVCAESGGCNLVARQQDRWGGLQLDPTGGDLATGAVCNGQYLLQARPAGADHWSGISVTLSDRTVDAVAGFTADGEPRETQLTWTPRSTSPDVTLHVERRPAGATSWQHVTSLPGTSSAYRDRGVAAGEYDYRVVATRGDGLVAGSPAPACSDRDADVTAASAARRVTVAPGPTTTPDATTSDGTAPGEPTGDGTSTGPTDATSADGTSADAGDGTSADAGGSTGSSGAPRTRVAAPPPPSRPDSGVAAPRIATPAAAEDTAAGEDDPFSEELDYGGVDAVAADDTGAGPAFLDSVVPGGWRAMSDLDVDHRRILTSIATGLLLVTAGLHLRRWMGEARD